eukprot:c1967_g1_i2.p1 GENE.c1967_g1_i2~~c1967_g1_i2.p1  ORF type:complete len:241 (-),score=51.28 c1967_g1_i2:62-784(-)
MAFVALRVFARVGGARTLPGFNAVVVNSRVPTAFAMSAIRTFASKPSIQEAKEMPREYYEMPNNVLITLSAEGDKNARKERLIREIMAVENLTWDEAQPKFGLIQHRNREWLFASSLPFRFGISLALVSAALSFPLVFSRGTALWFNERFVTTDIPPDADLETFLEVGAWTWNWMEPVLGQVSFFLLCLQFSRAQLENLGAKPYTLMLKHHRARKLCRHYPQYNKKILTDFAISEPFIRD